MKAHVRFFMTAFAFYILACGVSRVLYCQEANRNNAELSDLSLEDLLNIDVTTASKRAERSSDAPGIISVITKDDLERFGATTLKDILERVPGLISHVGFLSDRTLIAGRGDLVKSNSGHVLVLINGRPSRDAIASQNSDLYESFPVDIIEKIEVIKGPGSVLYGSDAFSAVINIITETADKNAVSATGLAGNGNAFGTSGDVKLKSGDLSVVAAGRYYKKAEWEDDYRFVDYAATFRPMSVPVDIQDKGPGAYVGLNYKGVSLMSTYTDWATTYFTSGQVGRDEWRRSFNNLGYDFTVIKDWKMDFNVTYLHTSIDAVSSVKARSCNLVVEWTNSIRLMDKSNLVIGGLFNYSDILETSLDPRTAGIVFADKNQLAHALYVQQDYHLLDNLKLIGGLQANKPEKKKFDVVPRLGAIWQPVSQVNIKALYSEAFKAPFLTEEYINIPYTMTGNPNLKPEKVATMDVGLSCQGKQGEAGVDYFRSKQTDIVQLDFTRAPLGSYYNLGRINFQGFEFEGKCYLTRGLYADGSMLYQWNKDGNGNENVTPVGNFGSKAGLSYAWEKGITVSLFDIYQGNVDSRYKDDLNPNQGAYNLLHLYSKISLNELLAMKFKRKFSLILDVKNLLDQKHDAYNWGDAYPNVAPADPGRAIYAGLNISL